jgi:magnesium-transporting ATPase (P-type)
VIDGEMLLRAWAVMGVVSAGLGLALFLTVLSAAGWTLGAETAPGAPLHHAYLQATTASFAAIVACQVGTAFAARTDRTSLWRIGVAGNRLLLAGIAFEIAFTAAVIYLPPLQHVVGTAALPGWVLLLLLPMPVIVWGCDEIYRWVRRRAGRDRTVPGPAAASAVPA